MKRKLLLALAVMSALGVASSGANAQSDEGKEEKKPEQSRSLVPQGPTSKPVLVADDDKKDKPKPELIVEDEKEKPKPELIAEGDDTYPKGSTPEVAG
jgi:outer membrane biosynthesis protein TonB